MRLDQLAVLTVSVAVALPAAAAATDGVHDNNNNSNENEQLLLQHRELTKFSNRIKWGGPQRVDFNVPAKTLAHGTDKADVDAAADSDESDSGEGDEEEQEDVESEEEEDDEDEEEDEEEPWPLPDVHEESECTADRYAYCENQYLCSEYAAAYQDITKQMVDYANMDEVRFEAVGGNKYGQMLSDLAEEAADYKFDMDCYCGLSNAFYNDYCRESDGFDPKNCDCDFAVVAVDDSSDEVDEEESDEDVSDDGSDMPDKPDGEEDSDTGVSAKSIGGSDVDKVKKEEEEVSSEIKKIKDMLSKLEGEKVKGGKERLGKLRSL